MSAVGMGNALDLRYCLPKALLLGSTKNQERVPNNFPFWHPILSASLHVLSGKKNTYIGMTMRVFFLPFKRPNLNTIWAPGWEVIRHSSLRIS